MKVQKIIFLCDDFFLSSNVQLNTVKTFIGRGNNTVNLHIIMRFFEKLCNAPYVEKNASCIIIGV